MFINLTAAYDTVLGSRSHLQAFASSAGQTHGLADHETCWKLQFYPYPWYWSEKQVNAPQEWRPMEISPGSPLI